MENLINFFVLVLALIGAVVVIYFIRGVRTVTIFEYQRGLKYSRGRIAGTLGPGRHFLWSRATHVIPMDVRPVLLSLGAQEVSTSDGAPVKITLVIEYQVTDAERAFHSSTSHVQSVHLIAQLALRRVIAAQTLDGLLAARTEIGQGVMAELKGEAEKYGMAVNRVDVRDIILAGDLKRAFADVIKARKEGEAALERARGETAALRSLANAAKMIEDNPNLMPLRALQVISTSTGNTIVLGADGSAAAMKKPQS